jgi:hypothetical protein
MKKTILVSLIVAGLINPTPFASAASKITPGSTCKKDNQQAIYKNKIYTCIKLGKKLYWDNGRSYVLSPTPTATASAIASATPTPAQAISPKPTTQPTPSPSKSVPLLRSSDFTFISGKLKVVWSGLDTSQQQITNVRKINVWVFDLQSEQTLAGGVWRVACYVAPTPGSFCEISLPPRDHAVRITASYLNGEQSSWSTTLRAKASPVVSTLPTDVVAGWG